jgi:phosphoribosylformimino-5-aminoimidazole carboxamide ribotide isomerase
VRLLPAIDIQGGRCVRLRRGDFADETVFGEDPVAMAKFWEAEGARFLHVVDLDGAREGAPRNFEVIQEIAEQVAIPVQAGGGLRSEPALDLMRRSRVAKAVLGTSAVENKAFLEKALSLLGAGRVVVAVDAEGGQVKTHGWQEQSGVGALELVRELEALGVREVLYTDISRDGMMESVNLEGLRELAEATSLEIIASGGVTGLDDLRALKALESLGVTGVIAGRALYERRFTVTAALAILDDGSARPGGDAAGVGVDVQGGKD